jgi:hypothetical protein
MQTKEIILNECPVDIMGIDLRLSFVEAVEEDGAMDVSYTYDMYREWVEVTEGGYVVESGYEYHPRDIQIGRIIHENLGQFDESHLSEESRSNLIQYIYHELYKDANQTR